GFKPGQNSLHGQSSRVRRLVQGVLQRGQVRRLDFQLAGADLPDAMEQAPWRRPGGAFTVLVVDATMTRTHEEAGLREPRHWAAQVSAVHGENQEPILPPLVLAQVAHINAHLSSHPVPRLAQGILERRQSGLVDWKLARRPQADPMDPVLPQGPEEV